MSSDVLAIAPMIQWTDRHWRFFFRGISRHTLLYSEMISANAIVYNAAQLDNFLGHAVVEEPLAVQLGGNDPEKLAEAAYLAQQYRPPSSHGFQEINLNAGCPSNKAKKQGYGAELMLEPDLVGRILHAMVRRATSSEISLKCRIGVKPGPHSFEDLCHLMRTVEASGVRKVVVHARLCELHGLSPAQNRTVPPLHPELVHRLVSLFPSMRFTLNGGIQSLEEAAQHVQHGAGGEDDATAPFRPAVAGVMIGRAAYHRPFDMSAADTTFFGASRDPLLSREEALWRYLDYADHWMACGEAPPAAAEDRHVHCASSGVPAEEADGAACCEDYIEAAGAAAGAGATAKSAVYGQRCSTVLKPLHNFFHDAGGNAAYKQALDLHTNRFSKQVDRGTLSFSEFVMPVVQETIADDFLQRRGR